MLCQISLYCVINARRVYSCRRCLRFGTCFSKRFIGARQEVQREYHLKYWAWKLQELRRSSLCFCPDCRRCIESSSLNINDSI
jgi:hypothetical protein